MKLCEINGSVLQRLHLGVWSVLQMATCMKNGTSTTQVHLGSPRGGILHSTDCLGVPFSRVSFSLAVVPAAPADAEPIPSTMALLLPPNPAENIFGPAPVGSIWFTLESGGGMEERSGVTIRADDVTICDAARGLLRRNGVTLAIAAWPPHTRTTLSGVAGNADEDDLRTLTVYVDPRGTRARSFADAVGAMREDPLPDFPVQEP